MLCVPIVRSGHIGSRDHRVATGIVDGHHAVGTERDTIEVGIDTCSMTVVGALVGSNIGPRCHHSGRGVN